MLQRTGDWGSKEVFSSGGGKSDNSSTFRNKGKTRDVIDPIKQELTDENRKTFIYWVDKFGKEGISDMDEMKTRLKEGIR